MDDINKVFFVGRIVADITMTTTSDYVRGNFCVAINKNTKEADGTIKNKVTFVELNIWNSYAELISPYCLKGNTVVVFGHLDTNTYEKNGQKISKMIVVPEKIQIIPKNEKKTVANDKNEETEISFENPNPEDVPDYSLF